MALLVAAVLVAAALPLWQKRGYVIALLQQAGQARAQADASGALRDELERLAGDYNFALQKKYAFPTALQSIEDVTKLLPDDTWLTQFEMKSTAKGKEPHREILVRGESANAGRLISLLEESKLFEQAAPRSPTTKIQPGPGEIFDLGAQLMPLPPPQPVAVCDGGRGRAEACRRGTPPRRPSSTPARPVAPEGRRRAGSRGARDDAPAPAPPRAAAQPRLRPRPSSGRRPVRPRRGRHDGRRSPSFPRPASASSRWACSLPSSRSRCRSCWCRCGRCTGTTTTRSPDLNDRIERYRRIAAQAPEYRKALEAMRAKDGRRFFLKNTAPNLAGAELQEQVRAAIESNGGRITTSQNQGPKDDGRFRQITVTVQFFASTPALQKILHALEAQPPVSVGREPDAAAAQRVPRLQARARPGAGSQRSARRRRFCVRGAGKEMRP